MNPGDSVIIDRTGLDLLVDALRDNGYRVIGPQVRDQAIVLDELSSGAQLPAGWGVRTQPGSYRLHRRDDDAVFAHSAGPGSWKTFLHPPHRRIARLGADLQQPCPTDDDAPTPTAFLGVRGCDLAAIATLNRVLGGGSHPDPDFTGRLATVFVVAVNCTEPGGVCFCTSMGTGPGVAAGYDLALTESIDEDGHRFVVDVGSDAGALVLSRVPHRPAAPAQIEAARGAVSAAADRMGRVMPDVDLPALLRDSRESPQWDEVASRCLTCANCTMVCPTCFCTSTEDVTDLTGDHAERWQRWASCFELDFSYLHGGSVRTSGAHRYRHWISHKLGTWHDQFGSSGCVGCGRCIAWCPAGIDITEEVARLAEGATDDDQQ
ncbi:4Fe-4S ferredoxin [Mycolicibacterium duvalii]|uniref:4Fe-4S ferredoxin n=1 Tax=Mycolicibacterium duvalii TaxID=39688 RepID=A0A7I7K9K8_9MYCO|nr:4Fe-4S dicluster domain-containing protein [Mycolicibacterium duvalii]MCV7366467.1 4Fe-4S dicluster domain-containing protein [Mycolicibacterium duvalii]PEG43747.1 4Fe-4S ferredoxin [Mycolicibacterium duvalii]BBX20294.1 4Fe-4S ferredoxin [Mycolicibacterium duvalii]